MSTVSSGPTRYCVVTGASRGIGRECAIQLAEEGWAVAVNFTSNAEAAAAVVEAITLTGGSAVAIKADVSKPADVTRLFDTAAEKLPGTLKGLVNNAGVLGPHDQSVSGPLVVPTHPRPSITRACVCV